MDTRPHPARGLGAFSSRNAGVGFGLDGSGGRPGGEERGASVDTPRGPLPFLAVPAGGRCLAGETGLVSGLVCPRGMLDQTELWPRLPVLCQHGLKLGHLDPGSSLLGWGHFTVHRPCGLGFWASS